ERELVALPLRDDRGVAVELGLIERPDHLLRGLGDPGVGRHQSVEGPQVPGDLLQLLVDAGTGRRTGLRRGHGWPSGVLGGVFGVVTALPGPRRAPSNLASRSSRRSSMLVRRSARPITSGRVGMLKLISAWVMAVSIALRKSAEVVSQ